MRLLLTITEPARNTLIPLPFCPLPPLFAAMRSMRLAVTMVPSSPISERQTRMPLSPQSRTWLCAISSPAASSLKRPPFADVADLAIGDAARDFAQHDAVLGAADDAAVRQSEAFDAFGDEQRAAVDRLGFAVEREPGQADARRVLDGDERAAAVVAKHGLARHALDLGARFQRELAGRVVAGREKEGRARLRGLVGRLLEARGLVDAAAGHDAIGAEGLRQLRLLARRGARADPPQRQGRRRAHPASDRAARWS